MRCQICKNPMQYIVGERIFKNCVSCREYKRARRPPYDRERQQIYSREFYKRSKAGD